MSYVFRMIQVRVPGFDFIGYGEASSKKDAQGGAAKMFCSFLVEQGLVDPRTLPAPLEVSSPYKGAWWTLILSPPPWRSVVHIRHPSYSSSSPGVVSRLDHAKKTVVWDHCYFKFVLPLMRSLRT